MPPFGRKHDSSILIEVPETRFTTGMVKIHKVHVEVTANGQHFASKPEVPGPADPVSHRYKCVYTDAKVQIPLLPWDGAPVVNFSVWDRTRRRKTCLGMVEVSVTEILNANDTKMTYEIPSTLFPALNTKIDVKFHTNVDPDDTQEFLAVHEMQGGDTESFMSDLSATDASSLDDSAVETEPEIHVPASAINAIAHEAELRPLTPTGNPDLLAPGTPAGEFSRSPSRHSFSSYLSGVSAAARSIRSGRSGNSSSGKSRIPRRHRKGDNFTVNVESNMEGIVYLEVVRAINLPRFRTLTGLSFDMDPFVVISFGKKNYKTTYKRHTTNPTFNQKLLFTVEKHELTYDVNFAVWDKDRVTLNDRVGQGSINIRDIRDFAPKEENGIYDLTNYNPRATVIPLEVFDAAHVRSRGKQGSTPELVLNIHYLPFPAVRQQMWRGIIAMYDGDESDCLNQQALTAMLNSIGSNLSAETISDWFGDKKTLSSNEIVARLEQQLKKDEDMPSARIISFRVCPVCGEPRLGNSTEKESLKHISFCATSQWSGSDTFLLDDRYVTSAQASRRWYTRFLSKFSFGSYHLGANNANILVQDRISGQIHEEKMSTYVRLGMRVLYATGPLETKKMQRMLKKYTLRQGIKYDSPSSASSIIPFIKFHSLDMSDVKYPTSSFKTFNEFFYRELKEGARPCENAEEPRTAVSLADCRLTAFQTVDEATRVWIKGKTFSIETLLGDTYPDDASCYNGGSLVIFRLAPQDYHRFHIPVDGTLEEPKHIDGEYYTVNPMAIRSNLDVYGLNARTVVPIDSPQFGRVMIVLVGAMMVGSIIVTAKTGSQVKRGDELGYFKFGGSTAVVLFEPGKFVPDNDLGNNSSQAIETLVRVGMSIGHTPDIPEFQRVYDTRKTAVKRAETTIAGGGSYMPFSLD